MTVMALTIVPKCGNVSNSIFKKGYIQKLPQNYKGSLWKIDFFLPIVTTISAVQPVKDGRPVSG